MKANPSRNFLVLTIGLALAIFSQPFASQAQTVYNLVPTKQVFIKVLGTSNVHDWDMTSSTMESKGTFKFDANHVLTSIDAFSLSLDAKTLQSKYTSLDNRAYKVLKTDKHPKIVYNLRSTDITTISKNKYLVKTLGDLTIGGVRKIISMNVNVQVHPDNTITCTGAEQLKLSNYDIKAPSYLAGTMKVGNDLIIEFSQTYRK